jgi:O-methyltransferase involved in polyketide biosynthesis
MEGVLYYLDPAEIAAVFEELGAAHDLVGSECELGFDVVSAAGLTRSNAANTDTLRTETKVAWACSGVSELSGWDARLQLVEIDDHGAFVPTEFQAFFNEAKARDGIAPASVMHFKRSPTPTS